MTKRERELEKRVKELERDVEDLKARPIYVPQPIYVPVPPMPTNPGPYPYDPWRDPLRPTITCETVTHTPQNIC